MKPLIKKIKGNSLLPFLLFLFVSSCLWLLQVLNERFETAFVVSVRVTGVPEGISFEEGEEVDLKALVRDEGIVLMGYELRERPVINLDYSDLTDNNGHLTIQSSAFKNSVAELLEPSTTLVQFVDETLSFNVMKAAKDVPVRLNHEVQIPAKCSLDYIELSPQWVTVAAVPDVLAEIDTIDTEFLSGLLLEGNKSVQVKLVSNAALTIDPSVVTVNFYVSEKLHRSVLVPVKLVGVPEEVMLPGIPEYVEVKFSVAKANVDVVKPSDFVVELNYYEYQNEKGDSVALSLVSSSPYVGNISYSPAKVKKVKKFDFGHGVWNYIF